jgi:sugar (pentulose or hexulose) kinase
MEGVAHAVRDIVQIAQSAAAANAHELRACGGGAQSDAWCSLKADVLGIPVIRSRAAETGLVGAAMAAAVGLGWHPDLRTAAARMAKPGRRFAPRARLAAAYARRAAMYDAAKRYALELANDT